MPKLSLLLTVLLASLSVSVAAPSNELTTRGRGLFGFGSSSRKSRPGLDPVRQDSDTVTCRDTTYGPEDFRLAVEAFFDILPQKDFILSNRQDFAQFVTPRENIAPNAYEGFYDKEFYMIPLIKGGKFLEQKHNMRDFAIISRGNQVVVDVFMMEAGGATSRCTINR
ncbi:hypothetical protein K3495_g14651 [Podosphaera aphanis]|nr:hypothetical protein K3495_g14651 [Podosphaera aphanis]